MSDNDFERRTYARLQQEIAETDTPQARYQSILDRWWEGRLAAAEEERRIRRYLDPFNTGLYD
jgi:hypothetical protein